ncbi:siderophore-interacting protein [Nakamurella flava]|uniref:Siderophore-interacting protein n=1 Tax=Nakamurella flava TaxID=2576308 RepID=A0A4U6QB07_9ACTN|nr:siderophore-interacting protein [Nakamurella flava]
MTATRIKPATSELLTLFVQRSEQVSPGFRRVTFGGGDIARFVPMGFDQWFRLFLPTGEDQNASLRRLPTRLDTLTYARYLLISKAVRPVLRNYTVRAYRPDGADGPELDVDFVLHQAADGSSGPAAAWAGRCLPGDAVAILDEGIGFNPPADVTGDLLLVADETGLPAVAGILASLPADAIGRAVVEVGHPDDRQPLAGPPGVKVVWVVRADPFAVPGRAALAAAQEVPVPLSGYGWVVGEQGLCADLRRYWLAAGMPKTSVSFCGYWKAGH